MTILATCPNLFWFNPAALAWLLIKPLHSEKCLGLNNKLYSYSNDFDIYQSIIAEQMEKYV